MNFWLHLEKGAKASAIFSRGNTFPFRKIPCRRFSRRSDRIKNRGGNDFRNTGDDRHKAQTGAKAGSSVKTTNSAAKAAEVYTEANPTAADGRFFSAGTPLSG